MVFFDKLLALFKSQKNKASQPPVDIGDMPSVEQMLGSYVRSP